MVRDCLKVLMAALALAGITGMYVSQVRRNGVLGLIGYVVLSAGYLGILGVTFVAAFVLPEVASSNPGFVNDVIAVDTGRGTVEGDIGALQTVIKVHRFRLPGRWPALRHRAVPGPRPRPVGRSAARRRRRRLRRTRP